MDHKTDDHYWLPTVQCVLSARKCGKLVFIISKSAFFYGSAGLNPYPEICIQMWMVMKLTLIESCVLPKFHQVYSLHIKTNIFSSKQKKSNITTGRSCFMWFLFAWFLFNATWKSNHFLIYTIIFGLREFGKDNPCPCLSSMTG